MTQAEVSAREQSALAAQLTRYREEIERRWLDRVVHELNRHGLTDTELRDSIPDYILGLAVALDLQNGRTMTERGLATWTTTARNHALTRIRLGFDIDEVLREFLILRVTILQVLGEHMPLTLELAERINDLIGGALRACVKSYVDFRDYDSRQQQARHIGFITHELRNPLSTAMVTTSQLRKQGLPTLTRYLELLDRNLKRLGDLIDETLFAQRLEVNAVESHPTQVRLGDLIEQALKGAEATARSKGVAFELNYDPEVILLVDPQLALSAVQNVVDNAAKFTDQGRVEVRVDDLPTEVVFHVYDDCEGISPEELRIIFEPFKRGHTGKPGTGLGLAIARRAVEAHGKTIHAESTETSGCHFWFALPKPGH